MGDRALELKRSVLLPYSVEQMFDLVERAEDYPLFLPWCTGVTIFERSEEWVAARIDFSFMKFRFGFRTRNPKQRPHSLQVRLVEGPFRHFEADWAFTQLGTLGCKVQFSVSYEIIDAMFDRIAAPAVGLVSGAMVEAFVKRANTTLQVLDSPQATTAPAPAPTQPLPAAAVQAAAPEPAEPGGPPPPA